MADPKAVLAERGMEIPAENTATHNTGGLFVEPAGV